MITIFSYFLIGIKKNRPSFILFDCTYYFTRFDLYKLSLFVIFIMRQKKA
jgi:hypothetical protein